MNDGRNLFVWVIIMFFLFIVLGILETALEVPQI